MGRIVHVGSAADCGCCGGGGQCPCCDNTPNAWILGGEFTDGDCQDCEGLDGLAIDQREGSCNWSKVFNHFCNGVPNQLDLQVEIFEDEENDNACTIRCFIGDEVEWRKVLTDRNCSVEHTLTKAYENTSTCGYPESITLTPA